MCAIPQASLAEEKPLAVATTLRNTPIIGWTGRGLAQIGMAFTGQGIGIYQYGQYPFGKNQPEYIRNSKISEAPQFIKRSDLQEKQTKSDVRPNVEQIMETTFLPLDDGGTARVDWYKKVSNKNSLLFAVGMVGTVVANPAALAALAVNPEAVAIGALIVGGVILYKIYEEPINDAFQVTKATLFILAAKIAAAVIVEPQALPKVPQVPDHILNHPEGEIASKVKTAIWILIWNQIVSGIPPDWCGRRASDGAYVVIYFGLQVMKITGGVVTRGVGIIFNPTGKHSAVMSIKKRADGRPQGGTFDPFVPLGGGCNPWDFLSQYPATTK